MKSTEFFFDTHTLTDEAIHRITQAGLCSGYALAAWKLPGSTIKSVLLADGARTFSAGDQLENLEGGFVFCPFNRQEPGYYLQADLLFKLKDEKISYEENPLAVTSAEWLKNQAEPAEPVSFYRPASEAPLFRQQQPDFKKLVAECVQYIATGSVEKIVPSRYKAIPLPSEFNPIMAFQKLCAAHPHALVSLVSIPEVGTWLGASPEILVQVEDHSIFRTVALAGTQPYTPGANLKEVAWTQKEIEEQALVSRYIINCFKKIRLREFEEHGPKTVVAGNLLHLKTDFAVDLKATNFPQLASVMLNLLHPTSAICGMPMEPALQFLKNHEGYTRQFYAGFLGPVNIDNAIRVYVNLRCMQVTAQSLVCYAGCGVTIDSVPQKEWEETEMKLNSLLTVVL
ncbi:MAG: chorismate-binding protein [Flammeovirgaceae bacterium]|nr:MAG: chorismate-binding protein [Flammeovirgaceae bacterium]